MKIHVTEADLDPARFFSSYLKDIETKRSKELDAMGLEPMRSSRGWNGYAVPGTHWNQAWHPTTDVSNWEAFPQHFPGMVVQVKEPYDNHRCMIKQRALRSLDDGAWDRFKAAIKKVTDESVLDDALWYNVEDEAQDKAWNEGIWKEFAELLVRMFQGVFANEPKVEEAFNLAVTTLQGTTRIFASIAGNRSGEWDWKESESGLMSLDVTDMMHKVGPHEVRNALFPESPDQQQFNFESVARHLVGSLLEYGDDPDYNAAVDFSERRDRNLIQLAQELKASRGKGRVSWPKIPAARLKRIWLDYGKSLSQTAAAGGFGAIVRDVKGLDMIADIVLNNIARLDAATTMMGHTELDGREELDDLGITFSDEQWDDWMDTYFTDESGAWTLSDYGLPKLQRLYGPIFNAATAEEKLQAIDKALNVIHQRSDLAALFVEGGNKTLLDIYNQGGYASESTNSTKSKKPELVDSIQEDDGPHSYSCVMIDLPEDMANFIIAWGKEQISNDVLYVDEDGGCGREEEIHVTVKYGLACAQPDDRLKQAFQSTMPFKMKLAPCSLFKNDKFDVVKLEVISPYLRALNRQVNAVAECPGDKHPVYAPHVTIAYVKPGTCDRLEGKSPFDDPVKLGRSTIADEGEFTSDAVIFSSLDGSKEEYPLGKHKSTAIPVKESDDMSPDEMSSMIRQSVPLEWKVKHRAMRELSGRVLIDRVEISTRKKVDRTWGESALLEIYFKEGDQLRVFREEWGHMSSLKSKLQTWRNLEGAPLVVNGQPAGTVSPTNPTLA